MKQNFSNDATVKWIILVILSVGIGSFISNILENIKTNIWLARGIGAFVTVIVTLLLYHLLIKKTEK